MKQDRWRLVDELFEAALDLQAAERAAFLREACAGDTALRLEVEELLGFDRQAEEFIETPVFQLAAHLLTGDAVAGPSAPVGTGRGADGRSAQLSSSSGSIDDARF